MSTDWSKFGIGFLVTQKHCSCPLDEAPRCCKDGFKIVFAGSKKCLDAESRYAPIEGEALGVVWSLDKARMFTLGCPDLLVTVDHQPLIPILRDKSLADIPNPRLYQFKERSMRYKFQIQYLPGDKNNTPDTMSRVHENNSKSLNPEEELETDVKVGAAVTACYITSIDKQSDQYMNRCQTDNMAVNFHQLFTAGKKDKEYTTLLEAIKTGFPETLDKCIPLLHPYFPKKEHFSIIIEDDMEIITYHDSDLKTRMVIPRSLRNRVKQILHANHRRDLVRVKQRAQEYVYWPYMTADLKAFIK